MRDNRCTQHSVLNDSEEERVIQRVTMMGDPVRGNPARWVPYSRVGRPSDSSRHNRILREYLMERG